MRWILIFLILESCLWGVSLNSARADIIGFQFKGSWTQVDSAFTSLTGGVGQSVTGSIYYDTTIIDKDSKKTKRAYYYGNDSQIIDISFTCKANQIQVRKARIAIFANYNGNSTGREYDEFQLWFNTQPKGQGKTTPAAALPQNTTGSFLLKNDTNKNLFKDDDSLPCNLDPLLTMSTKLFTLSLSPNKKDKAVAKINSITTLPVPEPGTVILLCLGLSLIFFYQRLNNRQSGFQKLRA